MFTSMNDRMVSDTISVLDVSRYSIQQDVMKAAYILPYEDVCVTVEDVHGFGIE